MTTAPDAAVGAPIDPANFDPATPASVDFYRHANGGWLDANPVPPAYGAWGASHEVNERNQALLHRLLVAAAEAPGAAHTPGRLAGDYFAAGMDEAAIAAAGIAPLQPFLDQIDAHRLDRGRSRGRPGPAAARGRCPALAGGHRRLRGCRGVPRLRRAGRPRPP